MKLVEGIGCEGARLARERAEMIPRTSGGGSLRELEGERRPIACGTAIQQFGDGGQAGARVVLGCAHG